MLSSRPSSVLSGRPRTNKSFGQRVSHLSPPTVLAIAGFDPSAGAGVLSDLKTLAAHGVYGMACITALTIQSTQGVRRIKGVDARIVGQTLRCLEEDASFNAIKIGMLGTGPVANAVADWLDRHPRIPVVVDPIIKSSSGKQLADRRALQILRGRLLARADWLTPNLSELAVLVDAPLPTTRLRTERFGHWLLERAAAKGNQSLKLVVTGGHLPGSPCDLLLTSDTCRWYPGRRIQTTSTHGTGCAFSTALAARLTLGDSPEKAVLEAKKFVSGALRNAYPVGKGTGPLDHFWRHGRNS